MKSVLSVLLLAVLLIMVLPLAAQDSKDAAPKAQLKSPVRGYLVDMLCARQRKSEGVKLGQVHTKMCLQMPACVQSGYAVMTPDNQLLKFDKAGTDKAIKLVEKSNQDHGFVIQVAGKIKGDEIQVSKIELLPPGSLPAAQ